MSQQSSSDGSGTGIANKPGAPPPPSQGGQVTVSGPKITVDYGEANQALTHLQTAFDTLNAAINNNQHALRVTGPGNEQPSGTFANNFNSLAAKELAKLINQRAAIKTMYDNLKAQLGSQQATEQANAANMNRING